MIRHLILGFFFLVPTIAAAEDPGAGKRVALVIGNGTYERVEDRLPNPSRDARSIAAKLDALGFDVISALDLDYRSMLSALRDFDRALDGAEAGLFFYAGHGMEYQGRNFLFPTDAVLESEGDVSIGLIDVGQILHVMETRVPTRLIFLDACRNNPLARRFRSSLGATRSQQIGSGLARIDAAVGSFIAYATAPGQLAEDGHGANSPFSAAMLHHLDEPGLDVEQLMRRVRNSVLEATNERQIPWNSSSLRGRFVLNLQLPDAVATLTRPAAKSPASSTSGPSSSPSFDSDDREAWAFTQALDTTAGFEAYLDGYCPAGRYCRFAKAALAAKLTKSERQTALDHAATGETERRLTEKAATPMVDLAKTLAGSWGRRRYELQNGPLRRGGCDLKKSLSRLEEWQAIETTSSPIGIEGLSPSAASNAMISKGFDIQANLAVHVDEDELYLVETKQHVGTARGFCRLDALGKSLFRDLMANNGYFAQQNPQTLTYGYDRLGQIEYASALITLETREIQRSCLAFIGLQGSRKRIDGFFCRKPSQAIDASEVKPILSRIKT